jgi:vitamin B12 transporter
MFGYKHNFTGLKTVYSNSDAGSLLALFTPAYINTSGGPGSSASMFLRGTNSYQTTVNWNGFTINSLSLGTTDLSLIPAAAADDISVVHGAAGSIAGSGNFGGSVLLNSRADWHNRIMIRANSEFGPWDSRRHSLSGKIGNPALQYRLHLFSHQSENNFSYTDNYKPGSPVETIKNNALSDIGLVQNLFVKLPGNNQIETGLWYQTRKKELPAIMGSYKPGSAYQRDSTLRVYTKWTKLWSRSYLSLNTAFFDENMLYRDKADPVASYYSVNSKISSKRIMGDLNYRLWILQSLSVDGALELSSLSAKANSYIDDTKEVRSAAVTAVKLKLPGFAGNFSMRKEFHNIIEIPLLLSAGINKTLFDRGPAIRASYSDQFRVPTFNDRYWQPGGNPNLLPESGYSADIGLVQDIKTIGDSEMKIEISLYNSEINNMIQWVPSANGGWWHPENRQQVRVRGLESIASAGGRSGRFKYNIGLSYNYARSLIGKTGPEFSHTGNQLMYVPVHTGSFRTALTNEKIFFGLNGNYSGSRYTGNDNNPAHKMPSFLVINSFAGYRIKTGDISGQLQLKVMNLFNMQYQVIRSFPMPGRYIHLGFTIDYDSR